jgi:hypothetical protein
MSLNYNIVRYYVLVFFDFFLVADTETEKFRVFYSLNTGRFEYVNYAKLHLSSGKVSLSNT